MLLKCELMLLKCQFNENTNQNGVLFPTKCLDRVLNNSCLVSIILDLLVSEFLHKTMFICKTHNSTSISVKLVLIALAHLDSTEKMHRLHYLLMERSTCRFQTPRAV